MYIILFWIIQRKKKNAGWIRRIQMKMQAISSQSIFKNSFLFEKCKSCELFRK